MLDDSTVVNQKRGFLRQKRNQLALQCHVNHLLKIVHYHSFAVLGLPDGAL